MSLRVACWDDELAASSSGNLFMALRTLLCPARGDMPSCFVGTQMMVGCSKTVAKVLQACVLFVESGRRHHLFSQGAKVVRKLGCHAKVEGRDAFLK